LIQQHFRRHDGLTDRVCGIGITSSTWSRSIYCEYAVDKSTHGKTWWKSTAPYWMPDATVGRDLVPSRHKLGSDISCKSECRKFCEKLND
jgi:hypothetical protein